MSTELRGLDLLDAAIAHIEAHPETWDQHSYRCETGQCLAGWAAELAGGQWVTSADDDTGDAEFMLAEPDDPPTYVFAGLVHVAERAERLLGGRFLNGDETHGDLFDGANKLPDLKRMRDALRNGEATLS